MEHRRRTLGLLGLVVMLEACVAENWGAFGDLQLDIVRNEMGTAPGPMTSDPTNAQAANPAAAALGMQLFFDPRYSADGMISCATCHDPTVGFQDARVNTSLGLSPTGRSAPTCLYGGGVKDEEGTAWQFWDGRRDSLWSQALGPPESSVEMGGTRTGVAYLIYDKYRAPFEAIFGPMPELRDEEGEAIYPVEAMPGTPAWDALAPEDQDAINGVYVGFGKAIDAYERQLAPTGSAFDQYWNDAIAGNAEASIALTEQQKRGLSLYIGKANCIACHSGGQLSDGSFHNLGVAQRGANVPATDPGRAAGITDVLANEFNCAGKWSDHPDKSQCAVSKLVASDAELGKFKTPSLRDVALTAPYMHTGEFNTLDEVVRFYNQGGAPDGFSGTRDAEILPLGLTEPEIADLVAFLDSFTGAPLPAALTTPPVLPE